MLDYHRKNGWTIIKSKLAAATFSMKETNGRIWVKAFRGPTSCKPSFFYTFKNMQVAEENALAFVKQCQEREAYQAREAAEKKANRAALKASNHWTVGDTVYTSWGYDQTNVDFFQIVALKPRSVVVRQVSVNCSDNGGPSGGLIAPRRFEFVGPEIFCPLDVNGSFSAGPCWNKERPAFRHPCYKWNGKAKYTSSNH